MFALSFSKCALVRVKNIHSDHFEILARPFSRLQGGFVSKLFPTPHSLSCARSLVTVVTGIFAAQTPVRRTTEEDLASREATQ